MGVSKNNGTLKSSILIGFSIIFTIIFGIPLFLETSQNHTFPRFSHERPEKNPEMWIHIRIYFRHLDHHINVWSSQHAIFLSCICVDILYKNVCIYIHIANTMQKHVYVYIHTCIYLCLYHTSVWYWKKLCQMLCCATSSCQLLSKHDDRLPVGHLALCNGLKTTSQRETLDRDKRGTLESNVKPWTPPKNKPSTSHKGWEDVFFPIGFWCQINFEEGFCLFLEGWQRCIGSIFLKG